MSTQTPTPGKCHSTMHFSVFTCLFSLASHRTLLLALLLSCSLFIFSDAQICNGIQATNPSVCSGRGQCFGWDNCIRCKDGYGGSDCELPNCYSPDQPMLSGFGVNTVISPILILVWSNWIVYCGCSWFTIWSSVDYISPEFG
jgi:hypothetical protein